MIFRATPLLAMIIFALTAANLCLFTVIITSLTDNGLPPLTMESTNPVLPHFADAALRKNPISEYGQVLAQPIFFKSRAPFVPAPPPAPVVQKAIPAPQVYVDPDFILGGIVINERLKKVYLFTKTTNVGTWVNEGESYSGWKVQAIQAGGVTISQSSRAIDLQLYKRP